MKEDCKKCPCSLILECGQNEVYKEALKQRDDILKKIQEIIKFMEQWQKKRGLMAFMDNDGLEEEIIEKLETIIDEMKK